MANIDVIRIGNTDYSISNNGYSISDDYSGNKKEIGTWLDGSKIYQDVVNFIVNANSSVTYNFNTEIPNFKGLIDYKVIVSAERDGQFYFYPNACRNNSDQGLSFTDNLKGLNPSTAQRVLTFTNSHPNISMVVYLVRVYMQLP